MKQDIKKSQKHKYILNNIKENKEIQKMEKMQNRI